MRNVLISKFLYALFNFFNVTVFECFDRVTLRADDMMVMVAFTGIKFEATDPVPKVHTSHESGFF
jgi:hypothetical protein